ncbi:Asp-tRNA(Asn)/Glu-tRNA(Gln) amidotransferase subunit GatA [Acetivibrio mesophilus]|uniref:Glutamyl-tRNA(Gln) amidotransferase subunit A n=1 Tax=Acetivibrio mesophilus TaxID=2487273 RepID=A0A4Q0I642_9FIRM|nr:Asp-tRNA(Asn)/Glu-tRNA(Gln) amidotransferase subunit GatA [Acetivibrio mesophilus]ODM25130.1 aspartyl/glutamyl-tRNA amidotransferase subunit A [Clostridium sp. Bc-iso-3]RXE59854.1 Asp-tRNA(Asn)/Glu-tRNA(Gln) amidotransferase subunit GatA [Acetivibrio mesophilus]HHV29642.1 Asp-tRNA(Asn)/Glu-tRNA(Gln) amidotransferase subunit GatA [Clostridium sp.]
MELYQLTVHEMCDLIRSKKVSVVELTQSLLDRINAVDAKIESYITVLGDEALNRAKKVQERIDKGEAVSPLAGIPMALKDNICTKNVKTTCASKMLNNFIPPYDATVSKKLYNEDTVLLGKLNMDEFAMGSSTENSYFKITRNPWNVERVPGGSSGGSAASVAAGMTGFALGSDTGGSIRQPASFCGIVGMKPTYGAVSRFGLVAFASSMDQIGPLTKDVTDCAIVLNAITGYDPMDSTSANIKYPDYSKALINDVKGIRIGIPKEYIAEETNPEVKKAVLDAAETLRKLGAQLEEFSLPLTEYAIPAYYLISSAEASSNLARYDGIKYGYRAEKYTDLLDLYIQTRSEGFGVEVKRRILLGTYALSSGYYDAYYKKALQVRTLIKNAFNEAFAKYDVLLGPTAPTTAYKIGEKKDNPLEMYLEDIYTVSVNIAGLPGLTIPCGFDISNLPIGLQLIGKPFDESTLLRVGYTFEQNTEYHKNRARI